MENINYSIRLEKITKSFPGSNGDEIIVLKDISLEFPCSNFTTLIGPNGCGKTTLLKVIAGLEDPDTGDISFIGIDKEDIQVGYVWQDYRSTLLPWLNVGENVAFPLRVKGEKKESRRETATKLINEFLSGTDFNERVYQLSGGQQQLVSILRGLVVEPDILLLDEPFSALDQERRWIMGSFVERAWQKRQVPIVFVSHDVDEAILLADRIMLMSRRTGKIEKILTNTLSRPRTQKMLTASEHLACRSKILEFLFDEEDVLLRSYLED